ncbi:MAG TPA: hypothetical protein VKF40_13060 [Burkholderiales bacterium]|nr:hypothetical protein [Burkholderiales bacterium]
MRVVKPARRARLQQKIIQHVPTRSWESLLKVRDVARQHQSWAHIEASKAVVRLITLQRLHSARTVPSARRLRTT